MVSRLRGRGDGAGSPPPVDSGERSATLVEEPAGLTSGLVQVVNELCNALDDQPRDGPVAVLLRGAPFRLPGDPMWPGDADVQLVSRWERALRRLERIPACSIAVVEAHCYSAALEVLLCTDYRIAVAETQLHLMGASGASWPGMGLFRLANQIGTGRARQLALVRGELTATEALAVGLVDQVVADRRSALAAASAVAPTLPGREAAIRRQLVLDAITVSYEEALGAHLAACDRELRRRENAGRRATDEGGVG